MVENMSPIDGVFCYNSRRHGQRCIHEVRLSAENDRRIFSSLSLGLVEDMTLSLEEVMVFTTHHFKELSLFPDTYPQSEWAFCKSYTQLSWWRGAASVGWRDKRASSRKSARVRAEGLDQSAQPFALGKKCCTYPWNTARSVKQYRRELKIVLW